MLLSWIDIFFLVFNDEDLAEKPTLFNTGEQAIENVRKFTYLGQVITTEENGCFTEHRISRTISKFNELRNVLTDINVNLRTRRKLLESCVRSRLTYGTQAWFPNEQQMRKLEICWFQCLRSMVKGRWKRIETSDHSDEVDYTFVYSNQELERILKTVPLRDFIYSQHLKHIAHICRAENTAITKKMLFAKPTKRFYRDPWLKAADLLGVSADQAKRLTQSRKSSPSWSGNGSTWLRDDIVRLLEEQYCTVLFRWRTRIFCCIWRISSRIYEEIWQWFETFEMHGIQVLLKINFVK